MEFGNGKFCILTSLTLG